MLGVWLCCCHSILRSGGNVHWYHHPFILPGFWRASRNSSICSSPSHGDSQWPKWDAETHPMTLLEHPRYMIFNFAYLLESENVMIFICNGLFSFPIFCSPSCRFSLSFASLSVTLKLCFILLMYIYDFTCLTKIEGLYWRKESSVSRLIFCSENNKI